MREGCWQPVPIQHATDPTDSIVFVGDGPTKTAFAEARAFSGQEGIYLLNEVKELDHQRKDFGWAYTVACRWPNDDPSAYLAKLR